MRITTNAVARRLLVGAAAVGCMIGLAAPAQATSTTVQGDVKRSTTYYGTQRTITTAGSNIYLKVTSTRVDLAISWYKCDDRSVHAKNPVLFYTGDSQRKLIGSGFKAGTVFCLAASADIGEGSAPWSGALDYNVTH